MKPLACLALLAACHGGGSSPPPFTPSSDLHATHPWLLGQWLGQCIGPNGITKSCRMDVDSASWTDPTPTWTALVFVHNAFSDQNGYVRADGSRVIASGWVNGTTCEFDLRASSDHQTLTGTYSIVDPATTNSERGTITGLNKQGPTQPLEATQLLLIFPR